MKPSILDVARAVGVSKSTVSRALTGDGRVKAETRRRVEEAARRLGYNRHRIASALARGRTFMVAVAPPSPPRSFSDPFFLEFLGALGDRLTSAGYNLVLTLPDSPGAVGAGGPSPSAPGSLEELVVGSMVDGAVLTEIAADDPRLPTLLQHGVPFVTLGTPEPVAGDGSGRFFSVDGDNVGAAWLAVRHLLDLGHREIACVTGPLQLLAARRRLRGFAEAMESAGAAVPPHRVVEADFTREGGFAAARRLLEAEREACGGAVRVSAIFACNDLMAIGVIEALRDAGLRVPEDISVVGLDGIDLGRLVDPPLTTAAQPIRQLGKLTAELLLEQLERRRPVQDGVAAGAETGGRAVVLPCVLQLGRSAAPPAPGRGTAVRSLPEGV